MMPNWSSHTGQEARWDELLPLYLPSPGTLEKKKWPGNFPNIVRVGYILLHLFCDGMSK